MLASCGGAEEYYTSGPAEDFDVLAPVMLGYGLKSAVHCITPFPLEDRI